ncbi:MAG TPA: peptidyl-prolyl cis-trans isomerase, partial [Thermoleophilaceae bacterium]
MTHSLSKLALTAVAASLGIAVFSGCGNDVPAGSVAKVGDSNITKAEFNKWLKTAAAGQAQGGGSTAVPDPPDYTKCVAAKKAQPSQTKTKPSDASLKKQCKQEYDQLKGEVMQFLIQSEWVQQEADARDVKVSDAEVKKSFEDQKKQAFPNDKAYKKFLASSGMSEADILFRVKLDQLQQKLTQKVTEDEGKVTNSDVTDYYNKNKKRFAQPERRDLNVVLTKTKAKADQAKEALDGGQSFKSVAKKFSIDQASKSQGGKLPDVAKGQQEKALDKAVFDAKKGQITGPVKTQFGYYVF